MYGALLGLAGGGVSLIGANKTKNALQGASRRYDRELDDYYGNVQNTNRQFQRQYEGVDDARLNRIGQSLQEYMGGEYGPQGSDSASIDQALVAVGSGGNPSMSRGGAAGGWGRQEQVRNQGAVGRQRGIAVDANVLARLSQGQSRSLGDMGLADMRFGRQVGDIQRQQALRGAEFDRQLQDLNQRAQGWFNRAQGAGDDWMAVGGLMGAGGSALSEWQAGQQPTAAPGRRTPGHDPSDYYGMNNPGSDPRYYRFN